MGERSVYKIVGGQEERTVIITGFLMRRGLREYGDLSFAWRRASIGPKSNSVSLLVEGIIKK